MAEADLLLIVEPGLVVWTECDVEHPLHEALLHCGFIRFIWLAIGREKPLSEVRLRADHRAPRIDHFLRVLPKDCVMPLEDCSVFVTPTYCRFELSQLLERYRRARDVGFAVIVPVDFRSHFVVR